MLGGEIDETDEALAALGVDTAIEKEQRTFPVLEENMEAVRVFVMCLTQWRAGSSGLVGLDYNVVFEVMALYDIKEKRDTFERVQIMEMAALKKANKAGD